MHLVGWQTRLAIDAEVAVLLPANDAAMGARVLLDKLEDVAWRSNAAAVCREMATGPFDRVRLGRQLERLLQQVVTESRGEVGASV